jgi:hypothetical protein
MTCIKLGDRSCDFHFKTFFGILSNIFSWISSETVEKNEDMVHYIKTSGSQLYTR